MGLCGLQRCSPCVYRLSLPTAFDADAPIMQCSLECRRACEAAFDADTLSVQCSLGRRRACQTAFAFDAGTPRMQYAVCSPGLCSLQRGSPSQPISPLSHFDNNVRKRVHGLCGCFYISCAHGCMHPVESPGSCSLHTCCVDAPGGTPAVLMPLAAHLMPVVWACS